MELLVKVVAVVQARMGSTRLPNKVMRPINGKPMIEILLSRLAQSKRVNQIVVATSIDPRNQSLVDHVTGLGFSCEQGSEDNVLERYVQAGEKHHAEVVVRITGDCPLVDPELVDDCIAQFIQADVDYLSNTSPPTYPDGLDVEVVRLSALKRANIETKKSFDREHVTPYVRESSIFTVANHTNDLDLSGRRWTVDDPEDFQVITNVVKYFAPNLHFSWKQVLELSETHAELFAANQQTKRNTGATMGTGQKLWQRAKRVIPGGNMLLSKRAEMFLPDQWPAYFSKAKGCRVWDLDGAEYIDMSIMGIGTNSLGYGHPEIDAAVIGTVQAGNMSTFNCPEEVYLAERLVELHPWADMVRLARSGGEANAIAIRIARAASGRDKVAICGYHGWHDWYLSANLADDSNLDGHLLPGLEPRGVPRKLAGSTLPFSYNDPQGLEQLLANNPDIGVIKMEVSRNEGPLPGYLDKVRDLATRYSAVLIFDECTSGFRETFGGLHKKYGVDPDMAMFGKAMGNGYAITAIVGRREIMEAAQTSFISSTFWTERIGPTAALKTLEVMERERSWEVITRTGLEIRRRWQELADRHTLRLTHWGLPALTGFTIQSPNSLAYKTLITQEMIARGFLATNSVYVCTDHSQEVVDAYFNDLDSVFKLIRQCEEGRDVSSLLKGPVCHGGFKRLN
jgi:glutamate-1-semialdehyde 2,1-aminomutase